MKFVGTLVYANIALKQLPTTRYNTNKVTANRLILPDNTTF